ncbi:hypothetical protein ABZX65_27165 [Streptomyces sp. NPDC003300]|uniref:hypothetical protein n=1 Tax=unclassified Streptomyces TaxID=2593676 RepID=UPI0033BA5B12
MSARDELRKYANLLADSWTPPQKTTDRVEWLYGQVRAEVLAEAADLAEEFQNDADDAAAYHHGGLTDSETAAHIAVRRVAAHLRQIAKPAPSTTPEEGDHS